MFTPFKNLITYIQKSTGGTTIFGGTLSKCTDKQEEEESSLKAVDISGCNIKETNINMDKMSSHFGNAESKSKKSTMLRLNETDDIELLIKSSILMKSSPAPSSSISDLNQNHVKKENNHKDKYEKFEENVIIIGGPSPSENEFYTICDRNDFDVTPEEFLTDSEDNGERFIELDSSISRTDIIDFESELSYSQNSEDPLAIDDISIKEDISALINKSANSDIICRVNVEEELISLDSSNSIQDCSQNPLLWLSDPIGCSRRNEDINNALLNSPIKESSIVCSSIPTKNSKITETDKGNNCIDITSEIVPSDGSDSGLGGESSVLPNTLSDSLVENVMSPNKTTIEHISKVNGNQMTKKPLKSNLKRRLDVDDDSLGMVGSKDAGNGEMTTTLRLASSPQLQKKPKRSINFDGVQIFYFPRQQGFGCVPSAGGCTLGMSARHSSVKTITLAEHAAELRRAHRSQCNNGSSGLGSSSDDSEESEEDYLSEGSSSDLDGDSNGFIQPVSPKQRRIILKAAGVRKIDASEKIECKDIRNSREVCGCTCRDFCDPDTCSCSQAGIKCQVDRAMFPCGCSRDACGNIVGRVEFNPARVRTHFIHTLMRLEMENRQQQNPSFGAGFDNVISSSIIASSSSSSSMMRNHSTIGQNNQINSSVNYYGLQTHSAYSSGYASPAYTNELTNFYQTQMHGHYPNSGVEGVVNGTNQVELHHHSPYVIDSLDSGLFGGSSGNSTPSYGELMPAYGTASSSGSMYNSMSYGDYINGQINNYGVYHPVANHCYLSQTSTNQSGSNGVNASISINSVYSSCAVPSMPPYGSATTTTASGEYQHCNRNNQSIDMVTPSSSLVLSENNSNEIGSSVNGSNTSKHCGNNVNSSSENFINLCSPIASSSRLSQINDLLQHNRNTTAALVAVSQCNGSNNSEYIDRLTPSQIGSINTPPIEDAHKSCLNFDGLPSPLHPTPIVAVIDGSLDQEKCTTITSNLITTSPIQPTPVAEQEKTTTTTPTLIPTETILAITTKEHLTPAAIALPIYSYPKEHNK